VEMPLLGVKPKGPVQGLSIDGLQLVIGTAFCKHPPGNTGGGLCSAGWATLSFMINSLEDSKAVGI